MSQAAWRVNTHCLARLDVRRSIVQRARDTRQVSRRAKIIWGLACLVVVGGALVLHGLAFYAFALVVLLIWVGTAVVHAYRRRRSAPASPETGDRE
jgi:4-amino-4-deoxy-L-arabinose transferase-like glycosyltransferase